MSDVLEIPRPVFTEEIVDKAYSEAGQNLFASEREFMGLPGDDLDRFQDRLLKGIYKRDSGSEISKARGTTELTDEENEQAGIATTLGLTLGHRIVRYASEESHIGLPRLAFSYMVAYTMRAKENGVLETDIRRDYGADGPVTDLLFEKLKNEFTRGGAALLFGLFGGWANPDQPPLDLPHVDLSDEYALPKQAQFRPRRRNNNGSNNYNPLAGNFSHPRPR